MTCSQFLDSNSDLIILVVNTIQRDLKSDNHLIGELTLGLQFIWHSSHHT